MAETRGPFAGYANVWSWSSGPAAFSCCTAFTTSAWSRVCIQCGSIKSAPFSGRRRSSWVGCHSIRPLTGRPSRSLSSTRTHSSVQHLECVALGVKVWLCSHYHPLGIRRSLCAVCVVLPYPRWSGLFLSDHAWSGGDASTLAVAQLLAFYDRPSLPSCILLSLALAIVCFTRRSANRGRSRQHDAVTGHSG